MTNALAQRVPLAKLKPAPWNPRLIKDQRFRQLCDSIQADPGFLEQRPILAQSDGTVYAGNMRLRAVEHLGWSDVPAILEDVSDQLAKERALRDNNQYGEWQDDELAALLYDLGQHGSDLQLLGFEDARLKALLDSVGALGETPADPGAQMDRAAELQEKWQTERGQLWVIPSLTTSAREHRLLCGDSTSAEDVVQLMGSEKAEMVWTDPPYGVAIGDKNKFLNSIAPSNRVEENLANDNIDEDALLAMLHAAMDQAMAACSAGAAWYVAAPAGPLHVLFGQTLKERGIWRQTIQWVKNNATFSPLGVDYHWRAEPIFYGWMPNGAHRYYGGRTQDTVWEIDRPVASPEHPTMKPVELVARAVVNSSKPGEIAYDPFLGSGSTSVACEQTGRICYGMEIEPKYVAVALQRLADMGLDPKMAE